MKEQGSVRRPSSEPAAIKKFIKCIDAELKEGWGFMPMLGSGIAVSSGIPTANKFPAYFAFCLDRAITQKDDPHSWDWPSFAMVKRSRGLPDESTWEKLLVRRDEAINNLKRLKSDTDAREGKKILSKLRTREDLLSDWRQGMECLSRLFNSKEMMGCRDERVIDSFFDNLVSARSPSLGHRMLAHLADALRIRTILTTNFDTLTEDAFSQLKMPLKVYPVHRRAGLPDARLVLRQRAIVKLHGGRFGLRADDSLHKEPENEEKKRFRKYFSSTVSSRTRKELRARKHLLVLGASCSEKRTMGFLRHALASLKEVQVYWVCYQDTEKEQVEKAFSKVPKHNGRVHVIVHPDIGLFLFHLYQHIYHSLPPAGADYPAFCRVPPDPYSFEEVQPATPTIEIAEYWTDKVEERIIGKLGATDSDTANTGDRSRLMVIDGKKGVSSVCSVAWDRLARRYNCIWLELDDFLDPEDLFVALLSEIARSVGMPPPGPFYPALTPALCREYLKEFVTHSFRKFVIFLDGRDGPGHSAGWESPEVPGVAKGQQPSSKWSATQLAKFWSFLCSPEGGTRATGIIESSRKDGKPEEWLQDLVVVVMVRSTYEQSTLSEQGTDKSIATTITAAQSYVFKPPKYVRERLKDEGDDPDIPACIGFSAHEICIALCDWCDEPEQEELLGQVDGIAPRDRFLYGLTLFRHDRHLAAVCSWGLIKATKRLSYKLDNDERRAEKGMRWLDYLKTERAVRNKPGGFIWMHRDIRDILREQLETREPRLKGLRAECHQGIADWYVKLFRSSNDPLAAIESLYHRLCCVEFADRSTADEECGDPEHIKETAFVEAITTLKLARDRIVSCGYFTASCNLVRRIAQSIGRMKVPRAGELTQMCQEMLRDFSREAANFRLAFRINSQLQDAMLASADAQQPVAVQPLSRQDLLSLEVRYYNAIILTGLRSYNRAEDEFHDLFRRLGFPDVAPGVNLWQGYAVHDMRKMGRSWARSRKEDPDCLQLAVRSIRRYMFLEMLIAQVHEYLAVFAQNDGRKNTAKELNTKVEDAVWVRRRMFSETLYVLTTEIMRYVDDDAFLQIENAYLRTLDGVLMATLGRYSEAQRRLNEASGYLAHSAKRGDAVPLAVADLRRAETYLLIAEDAAIRIGKGEKEASEDAVVAYLEDAVFCLDRVQANLNEEQRMDVWWWTLMHELRMRACLCLTRMNPNACENPGFPARFCLEPRCIGKSRCIETLRNASDLIVADPFRMARLSKMLRDLVEQSGSNGCETYSEDLARALARAAEVLSQVMAERKDESCGRYPLDKSVLEYVESVQAQLMAK